MSAEFTTLQEKRITLYFKISILIKGAISLAEIAAGLVVLFIPVTFFAELLNTYAQGELIEDPTDFIATHLVTLAQQFSVASGIFIAAYLLTRGLVKVLLIGAMLKRKLWAYPAALVVMGLFILYQLYQIATGHSTLIIVLTIFDLIVVWFIWREYQVLKFEA